MILAMVAGELNPAQLVEIDEHLATCDDCVEVVSAAASDISPWGADGSRLTNDAEGQTVAGRFEIVKFIAQGGMGEVYEGRDTLSGERVAIKRLKAGSDDEDAESLLRFTREGEILARLNHPNIVKMLQIIDVGRQHHIVMEYVPGGSLRDVLRRNGKLPSAQALQIVLQVANALSCAHRLNIIHRDLKPENVLLAEDGTPRVVDFGLARMGEQRVTASGTLLGTVAYLSPEALRGQHLNERTDIWGLGVLLFEVLCGRHPFRSERPGAMLRAILTQPTPDLSSTCPNLPIALVELLQHMLEKDPGRRSQSMHEIAVALEAILQDAGAPLQAG